MEVERPTADRTAGALAVAVIAAIVLLQVWLVGAVFTPRTFFSGDAGVRFMQIANLLASDLRSSGLRNPADRVDPDYRFTVYTGPHYSRRDAGAPYHGAYSDFFNLPAALAVRLMGTPGLYAVPILGGVGTMVLVYLLARRHAPHSAWLAPLAVGAGSPLFFYSIDLWEHSLAAMFATAAVVLLTGDRPIALWRYGLAGVALAAAISIREELYGIAPALLIAAVWYDGRRIVAALALTLSTVVGMVPHWWLKLTQTGAPVRGAVARFFYGATGGRVELAKEQILHDRAPWTASVQLLAPPVAAWLAPLVAALALRAALSRWSARWQGPALIVLAMLVVGWACADLAVVWTTWSRPNGILQAFPVALFLLFVAPAAALDPARSSLLQLLAITALFVALTMIAGPVALREAPLGGSQFGPRLLLPAFGLLAAAAAIAVEQRGAWTAFRAAPALVAATFAALLGTSLLMQVQGVREMRQAKDGYERLVQATEQLPVDAVVATDLWWYPQVTAAVLYERQTVRVDRAPESMLPEFLVRLRDDPARELTLVSSGGELGVRHAQALADEGWVESDRRNVPIWTDVHFVSYRRTR